MEGMAHSLINSQSLFAEGTTGFVPIISSDTQNATIIVDNSTSTSNITTTAPTNTTTTAPSNQTGVAAPVISYGSFVLPRL